MPDGLVDGFFRYESGRLVAVLTRIFGWRRFDLVEDMVQAALDDALQVWSHHDVPANPSGWVHRVAMNRILDALRRDKAGERAAARWTAGQATLDQQFEVHKIEDSQMRMIFACCHPRLARVDQLALTLKTLCGFGVAEIARALLLREEAVKKRLQRARRCLSGHGVLLVPPQDEELDLRLAAVHQVLYLLFNEGHSAIRSKLCEEAVWLCHLLCSQPRFATPATPALMALMLFHAARLDAVKTGTARSC